MVNTAFFFIQLFFLFYSVHGFQESYDIFPPDSCSVKNQACQIHADNLINSVNNIQVDECRQLCFEMADCKYFSHFGRDNYPIKNYCMLFSDCQFLADCDDCYSEDKLCYGPCGRNVESTLDDNVIEFIPDVLLDQSCKVLCYDNSDCLYYTHYGKDNTLYPDLCVLLSDIKAPIQECHDCVTSIPDCRNSSYACKFTINQDTTFYESNEFNYLKDSKTIVKFPLASSLECELTFVAVGGGGRGSDPLDGGAGSGNVEYVVIDISSDEYEVRIKSKLIEIMFHFKSKGCK